MFSKSNLLATLAATVTMFVLGYVLWAILAETMMSDQILTNIMKDPPDFLFIIIGNLVSAFALSSLYSKWARGHHSAKEGAEFGAWIGLFVGLGSGMIWYATSSLMTLTGHLMDFILYLVFFVVAGVVIALVYKGTSAKPNS